MVGEIITPGNLAKCDTEHGHQLALFSWANNTIAQEKYPELNGMFAIPNGGLRNKITANRLKAEGVKSGVPDIFLPVARHGCHGLFIEMKRPKLEGKAKGSTQNNQKRWIDILRSNGYGVAICYGFTEARQVLEKYLS